MPGTMPINDVVVTGLDRIERTADGRLRCSFHSSERTVTAKLVFPEESVPGIIEGIRHFVGYELYPYERDEATILGTMA